MIRVFFVLLVHYISGNIFNLQIAPWENVAGAAEISSKFDQSELERENFVDRQHHLYLRLSDAFLPVNKTFSRISGEREVRQTRDGGTASGRRQPTRHDEKRANNISYIPSPQSMYTKQKAVVLSRREVQRLPYSPQYKKNQDRSAYTAIFSDEGDTTILSRQRRDISGKDGDDEPRSQKTKRSDAVKSLFSYDASTAAGGGLKGYPKSKNTAHDTVEPADDGEPILAFDVTIPNVPKPPPGPVRDPVEMRRAMEAAMRRGRQQYLDTVGNDRPPHCVTGSETDRGTLIWTVGRPTNRTRFAYESEFAGRRMAEEFTGGNAQHIFDTYHGGLEDDDECYAEDDVECSPSAPYRTYDGTCNNLQNPQQGAAGAPQRRLGPAHYQDGISVPYGASLPSARLVSTTMSHSARLPEKRWTSMFTPVEKIPSPEDPKRSITPKCCGKEEVCLHPACFPVSVPADDPFYVQFGVDCLEFVRAQPAPRKHCRLGPRRPINLNTAYIDGSQMYGSTAKDANRLRAKRHGLLKINTSPIAKKEGLAMIPGGRDVLGCVAPNANMPCVDAGDLRANQHTGLVALHTLLLREHNRIATYIHTNRPELSDETIYQATRKIMGAILQHIVYKEMIPIIVGKTIFKNSKNGLALKKQGFCDCYDEDLDATIDVEFMAAAFRYHTILSDWLPARDENGRLFPLYQHFQNPKMFYKSGILDEILVNGPHDIAEKFDNEFAFIVQNQLFKPVSKPFGHDMFTLNVQRSRDTGTATYLQMRQVCGMPPIHSFQDLHRVMRPESVKRIMALYKSPREIDLFVGGVSEKPVNGDSMVGPTFACIATEQFKRIKNGDRFWYENEGVFSPDQLQELRKYSLAEMLCINTPAEEMQKQVFSPPSTRNPLQSCDDIISEGMELEPFLKHIKIAKKA